MFPIPVNQLQGLCCHLYNNLKPKVGDLPPPCETLFVKQDFSGGDRHSKKKGHFIEMSFWGLRPFLAMHCGIASNTIEVV